MAGLTFEVAAGASVSDIVDCGNKTLLGLEIPAGLTSTSITLKGLKDGADVNPSNLKSIRGLSDATSAYTITINASAAAIPLNQALTFPWRYVQLVMGSAEPAGASIGAAMRKVQGPRG